MLMYLLFKRKKIAAVCCTLFFQPGSSRIFSLVLSYSEAISPIWDTAQPNASSICLLEIGLLTCMVALKCDRFLKMGHQTLVMLLNPSLQTGISLSAMQLWDFHTSATGWTASTCGLED